MQKEVKLRRIGVATLAIAGIAAGALAPEVGYTAPPPPAPPSSPIKPTGGHHLVAPVPAQSLR